MLEDQKIQSLKRRKSKRIKFCYESFSSHKMLGSFTKHIWYRLHFIASANMCLKYQKWTIHHLKTALGKYFLIYLAKLTSAKILTGLFFFWGGGEIRHMVQKFGSHCISEQHLEDSWWTPACETLKGPVVMELFQTCVTQSFENFFFH